MSSDQSLAVALAVMSIEMDVEEVARARTCRGKRRSKVNAVHRGSKPASREKMYQVRPTSGDEADVHAQLEKQRKIEESHGSVERRTHKLGRRMSMFSKRRGEKKFTPEWWEGESIEERLKEEAAVRRIEKQIGE